MGELLRVEQREGVWKMTLNRPEKRNALSGELIDQLLDLVSLAPTQHARVLVFRGEGRNFSAGFDFSGLDETSWSTVAPPLSGRLRHLGLFEQDNKQGASQVAVLMAEIHGAGSRIPVKP